VSIWLFILAATALGGALVLWHAVSRTKHVSEQLLVTYGRMLVEARAERARKLAAQSEEADAAKTGEASLSETPGRVPQAK
jgi:hypothetical protein